MATLYRVQIGEDVYVGEAEEVVRFMARAEGAPGNDLQSYMAGIAARIGERLGVDGIVRDDAEGFLESLAKHGVVPVQVMGAPSEERADPQAWMGDDEIVTFGEDVNPDDVDLD